MNKLIVVTGATRGIGRSITERFAREGFDVAVSARTERDLSSLKTTVESQYPVRVHTCPADLAQREQVKKFSEFVLGLKRPVDVLVNNAGDFVAGAITTEPDSSLERMINVNLYSAYHLTRGLVPSMKDKKSGHIFNMCSIASIKAYPNGGSYAISKFALLGFSKVLREELKEYAIRVTAILPGATWTDSWAGSGLPESRFIKSEDVADAVFACYSLSGNSVVEELIIRPQLGDI